MELPRSDAPLPGDRVVVRYRLGAGGPDDWRSAPNPAFGGPTLSDVTGVVVESARSDATDPDSRALILDRDGEKVSVPHDAIASVRTLSRHTVRNSDIRAVEYAAALAWPGVESTTIGGWLARAGGGFTRRANSAVPVERGARVDAETLATLSAWYAERDLPLLLAWPDRLLPPAHRPAGAVSAPVQVLTASLTDRPAPRGGREVRLSDAPSDAWLARYRYADDDHDPALSRPVVTATASTRAGAPGIVVFAEITDGPDDPPLAIARGAVTESPEGLRTLGIAAVHTDAARRGAGLGAAIMATLMSWGADQGATLAYVQVENDNRHAGAWYRRMGFGLHHEYRYIAPDTSIPPSDR